MIEIRLLTQVEAVDSITSLEPLEDNWYKLNQAQPDAHLVHESYRQCRLAGDQLTPEQYYTFLLRMDWFAKEIRIDAQASGIDLPESDRCQADWISQA